jgi:inorganic pyrophosphatase
MSFKNIPFGTPEEFNVLIEISKGSQNKYEYNEETDEIELDWVFVNNFCFPFNYGLIPETKSGDGDNLDAFVISSYPINMGAIVKCKPIGMIELTDREEEDNKILAVAVNDPEYNEYDDIEDLSFDYKTLFKEFFDELAKQKNKAMEIKGYYGKERALEELDKKKTI